MVISDGSWATIKWYYCFAKRLVDMILDYNKCIVYNNEALCYFMTHLANKFCGLIWRGLETHKYLVVILFRKWEVCAASLFIYKGCILSESCESFIKMISVLASFLDFSMVMFLRGFESTIEFLLKQGPGSARIFSDMFRSGHLLYTNWAIGSISSVPAIFYFVEIFSIHISNL